MHDIHTRVLDIYKQINEERIEDIDQEKLTTFRVGDKVYMYHPTTKKGLSRKWVKRWRGPYTIIKRTSNVNYTITKDGHSQDVHVQRLRLQEKESDLLSSHEYDITLANEELEAINEAQRALINRTTYIQQEKDKLEASRQIEQNESNINCVMVHTDEDMNYLC